MPLFTGPYFFSIQVMPNNRASTTNMPNIIWKLPAKLVGVGVGVAVDVVIDGGNGVLTVVVTGAGATCAVGMPAAMAGVATSGSAGAGVTDDTTAGDATAGDATAAAGATEVDAACASPSAARTAVASRARKTDRKTARKMAVAH